MPKRSLVSLVVGLGFWGLATSAVLSSPLSTDEQILHNQQRQRDLEKRMSPPVDVRSASVPDATEDFPKNEEPCFAIKSISFQGDPDNQFSWLRKELEGVLPRCMGERSIQVLMHRLQNSLITQGFITTRIVAAPQNLSQGELQLTIVPGKVHDIRFTADSDPYAVQWNALPSRPGKVLNVRDVEQGLENFRRVPTAQADIGITPSPSNIPGESDLEVSRKSVHVPFRLNLNVDDSGSKATGKYQGAATLSWDNPLFLNDLFYTDYRHSLTHANQDKNTQSTTLHYEVPYHYWLAGITWNKYNYLQTVQGDVLPYEYRGRSENLTFKLSRVVFRNAWRKMETYGGLWWRRSSSYLDDVEIDLQHRQTGGWLAGIHWREFIGAATLDTDLSYKRGTGIFQAQRAPEEVSGMGTSRMKIYYLDSALTVPLATGAWSWRYTGEIRAQVNDGPLTPQDYFSIAGRYTVRGFDGEMTLAASRGWLWRNEMALALGNSGQELYAGMDYGQVSGPCVYMLAGHTLIGSVLGLRGSLKKLTYDVFVGHPLQKPDLLTTPVVVVGFAMGLSF